MGILKIINSVLQLTSPAARHRGSQTKDSFAATAKACKGTVWDHFVKTILYMSLIIVFVPSWGAAGINTAAFLNGGIGARALGMGGAFTAVADDTSAPYWNPAGLGFMESISIGSMVQQTSSFEHDTLKDITPSYNFFNVILPLNRLMIPEKGVVSLSIINNSLDKIPYTFVSSDGDIVRQEVTDSENAYMLSYGRQFMVDGLSVGGGIRFINQTIDTIPDGSASGYGVEAGVYYRMDENLRFGFVTQSGVQMKWDNGHTDYGSMRNRAGIAYNAYDSGKISVLISGDLLQAQKRPLEAHLGSELGVLIQPGEDGIRLQKLALRAGIDGIVIENRYNMQGRLNENLNWTFGLGFDMRIMQSRLSLDYALGSTALGDRHRISFSLYF